ncbi:MAG TPA: ABC transporter substrate-binding protein, partial [Anaerolineales bacterium]|nr:ABC transporter substrate-binding protein [Anaerolineales bacterium]
MKRSARIALVGIVLIGAALAGCAPAPTPAPTPSPVPPTFTPSPVPPTPTPEPTSTATASPTPTPLPGLLVLPVDTLDNRIPWLQMDKSARPGVYYFYFNLAKPPFNNVLVRQAFAAAIDREALVEIAKKYKATDPRPATSLTPPGTLGRDLYGEVGIPFDPTRAKELLTQAGYTDSSSFP